MTEHLPGYKAMKAAAEPGTCPFCGDPLKENNSRRGRKWVTCGSEDCKREYFAAWKRDSYREGGQQYQEHLKRLKRPPKYPTLPKYVLEETRT